MVHFCENVTDCRRAQQLEYFAEHFTREQCMENRATACDNCLKQGEYKVSLVSNVVNNLYNLFNKIKNLLIRWLT
jgi:superfamily II DNA helicase RecQ